MNVVRSFQRRRFGAGATSSSGPSLGAAQVKGCVGAAFCENRCGWPVWDPCVIEEYGPRARLVFLEFENVGYLTFVEPHCTAMEIR